MSELADRARLEKRGWARPGSGHDHVVAWLKLGLPAAIGVLLAFLVFAPLSDTDELSFLLDKNKVDVADERMRLASAQYRGQDARGRPFRLVAGEAVQASSAEPVVDIRRMAAELQLDAGPARLEADRARYDMAGDTVDVAGPILFTAADGYRMETRDVRVDLRDRAMASRGPVEGRMPLGRFSANRLEADLDERRVLLTGRVRLHMVQDGAR